MEDKQEHGLSYKLISNNAELVEYIPMVRYALKRYLNSTQEALTVDQLIEIIGQVIDTGTYFLFVVMDKGVGIGLMTAFTVRYDADQTGVQLHVGYVDPDYIHKTDEIKKVAFATLEAWSKTHKAKAIFTQTKRSDRGFDKMMSKQGFQRSFTVYEKEIKYGNSEEDHA